MAPCLKVGPEGRPDHSRSAGEQDAAGPGIPALNNCKVFLERPVLVTEAVEELAFHAFMETGKVEEWRPVFDPVFNDAGVGLLSGQKLAPMIPFPHGALERLFNDQIPFSHRLDSLQPASLQEGVFLFVGERLGPFKGGTVVRFVVTRNPWGLQPDMG